MNVHVSLRLVQRIDGEQAETELTALGTLEHLEDGVRLTYTEAPDDGGADVTVTARGAQLVIERRGEISSRMILEQDRRHLCRYDTPYGSLSLSTQAQKLLVADWGNTVLLQAVYTLDMNGACTEQEIEFRIKEVSQ